MRTWPRARSTRWLGHRIHAIRRVPGCVRLGREHDRSCRPHGTDHAEPPRARRRAHGRRHRARRRAHRGPSPAGTAERDCGTLPGRRRDRSEGCIMTTHTVLGASGVVGRETGRSTAARRTDGLRGLAIRIATVAAIGRNADRRRPARCVSGFRGAARHRRRLPHGWTPVLDQGVATGLAGRHAEHDRCLPRQRQPARVLRQRVRLRQTAVGPMTESTPFAPVGKKGAVRAALVRMLETAAAGTRAPATSSGAAPTSTDLERRRACSTRSRSTRSPRASPRPGCTTRTNRTR